MFVHSLNSLSHIFYNMFALLLFGIILESVIGSKRFLMIYFASGIASGLVGLLFYSSIIGASGAIFGILGTLGILRPKLVVWVMGVPMPMLVALVIWALLDFIGIFGSDNVAHLGHLAGLGTGVVYGFLLRPKYGEKKKPKIKILSEDEIKKWENEWMKSG
ncbi:MAG: rhomboid family intramembrane serine protease [Candidatus Aenigmarchaeota archaeon]|nr:rhomboid family intramembrane serine protease [Candidatus Aenigmarchaeota archaeon]